MSASPAPALSAIALQLATALERYQLHVDEMVTFWMDRQMYSAVSHELDQIRLMKGSLPKLSIEMVEVLIRHVELTNCVWNMHTRPSPGAAGELARLRAIHRTAVEVMREKCLKLHSGEQ
jgi:hypothetical protein